MRQNDRLRAVHAQALKEFDLIQEAVHDEREECLRDRRFCFVPGAQWEGSLLDQFQDKARFEMNKIAMSLTRAMGEARNNPITISFVSKDGSDSDLADACNKIFRAIDRKTQSVAAYNNAREESWSGGIGALRLRNAYENEEDPDDDQQCILIEAIYEADSCVFFDIGAKDQEKSDAKHCFVLTSMTPQEFEDEYGISPSTWDRTINNTQFDWCSPDLVYIAEYYKVEMKSETIRVFKNLLGEEEKFSQEDFDKADKDMADDAEEGDPEAMNPDGTPKLTMEEQLKAQGYEFVRTKTVKRRKIHKYILSGIEVLEDCGYIAGKNIPIVPFYGQRRFIDGVERCQGLVRIAKDAQRLKNMQTSKLAEQSAMASNGVPIFTPEQMAGHTEMWRDLNRKNFSYALVNTITDQNGNPMPAGPIAYTQPPQIAPAQAALLQLTDQDMKEMLAVDANQDKVLSNISGKAVELQKMAQDVSLLIYFDNFAVGLERVAEVFLGMAPEVYVEPERKVKALGAMGDADTIVINKPSMIAGKAALENDMTEADFDVTYEIGPSSTTQRQATLRAMMDLVALPNMDPQTGQVLQLKAIQNMDGEGVADVQEYARKKLVQMGVGKPTDEEAAAMAQQAQAPDQQQEALRAMANQADAEATKARADVVETIAATEKLKAQTMQILVEIENDKDSKNVELIQQLKDMMSSGSGGGVLQGPGGASAPTVAPLAPPTPDGSQSGQPMPAPMPQPVPAPQQ